MPYIKSFEVLHSSSSNVDLPYPWRKDPVDLNKGAGGLYIYLFKKMGNGSPVPSASVTGVTVLQGQSPDVPAGYQWDDTDLNKSVGGAYLYLAWTCDPHNQPIVDVQVVYDSTREGAKNKVPPGWDYVDVDLNKGAGGDYIYLAYCRGSF